MYVLSGQLRLRLAEHDFVMKPGEAAEFDTRVAALVRRGRGRARRAADPVRPAGRAHARPGPAAGASAGNAMKYMMLFWVDESAETTADEDAAVMVS